MLKRTLLLGVIAAVVAAGCTATPSDKGTGAITQPELPADETTTTTTATTPSAPEIPLSPPERGSADDVASDAFWDAGDYDVAADATTFDEGALAAIEQWLPAEIVDGLIWEVFTKDQDITVLAVSVIPALTWRGDPNLVPTLISSLNDVEPIEDGNGIYRADIADGLRIHLWSTGDGFLIATSIKDSHAVLYLDAMARDSEPNTVWEAGACLFIDPESETLPYAPFPPDVVVPCDGPHNAEVIFSEQVGTPLTAFDESDVTYRRNYECDRAYNEAFGSQFDHTPSLVTYMPDADEWDRGDRYLSCVVQIDSADGSLLFTGSMAERSDLEWDPAPGACLPASFAIEEVDCGSIHGYQYIGTVTVSGDEWPDDDGTGFDAACSSLVEEFVTTGPARIETFTTGLYPYAFEQGDRSVRCMAYAEVDGFLAEVFGSFDGVWQVIESGGIAA